jgi:hypothetical protein
MGCAGASVAPQNEQRAGEQVASDNVLVVDREFTDINEGNKLRRMVIGPGFGQSTLDSTGPRFRDGRIYSTNNDLHHSRL